MRQTRASSTVRTKSTKASLVLALALMLIGLATTAIAAPVPTYDIDKDPNHVLYGTLNQNLVPLWGNVACAPTAAVNSFVYLQNKYPGVYGNKLVNPNNQAGMIAAVQALGAPALMNTIANKGTFNDDFIYGKWTYIEQNAPNLTVYEAQDNFGWNVTRNGQPILKPAWVNKTLPTWNFLWNELSDCEDVEIAIEYENPGPTGASGHMLTLSSFHWKDLNADGIIQRGEGATIDYVDPWVGAFGNCSIWQNLGNPRLEVSYGGGAWVHLAVSESPVPLPPALWSGLALLATAPVIRYVRRRKAA